MDAGIDFAKVAPFLQHPLVLAGFALLVVFGLFRAFLKSDRLRPASGEATGRILASVARYGFILALAVVLLGFALEFHKQSNAARVALDPDAIVAAVERQALEKDQLQRQGDGAGAALGYFRRALLAVRAQTAAGKWFPTDAKWEGVLVGWITALERDTAAAR